MYVCVCIETKAHDEVSKREKAYTNDDESRGNAREPPEELLQRPFPPRGTTPCYCARWCPHQDCLTNPRETLAQTCRGNVVNDFVNPLFHLPGKQTVVRTRLSSSVQTRRAHNLIFLGAFSSVCFNSISIPSHQHLRCRSRQGGRRLATSSDNPKRKGRER